MSLRTSDSLYTHREGLGRRLLPNVLHCSWSAFELCPQSPSEALLHICIHCQTLSCLSLPCSSLSQKPLCPQFPDYVLVWGTVCVKLLRVCKGRYSNPPNMRKSWDLSLTRGSHLYVWCRSACDRDQNWIKQSSADQGDFWTAKINGSRTHGCNLTFDPLKIKHSRTSEGNNQAIKHTFANQKPWSRLQTLQ